MECWMKFWRCSIEMSLLPSIALEVSVFSFFIFNVVMDSSNLSIEMMDLQ